jgi:hypothetical protein
MKQKSSTEASKPATGRVLLRSKDSQASKDFAPDHAERLLAYTGSRWERADGAAPQSEPEIDETGHPTAS